MRRLLAVPALAFAGLFLAACASPPLPPESVPIVALMAERLQLSRDIAWAKWADGLPVRNPAREQALLSRLVRQGAAADIDEILVLRFFRAQIEASCLEQEAWMRKWRAGEPLPPGEPPTLDELRTRIDRLSSLLLAEYASAWNSPANAARARLKSSVLDPRSAATAASGFPPAQ
jgi:chorismate mutase